MIHHPPPPLTRGAARAVSDAVVSGAAWNVASARWQTDFCRRRGRPGNWRCLGSIDVHEHDGSWSRCRVWLRVFGDFRYRVVDEWCEPPTAKPTVPVNTTRPGVYPVG